MGARRLVLWVSIPTYVMPNFQPLTYKTLVLAMMAVGGKASLMHACVIVRLYCET